MSEWLDILEDLSAYLRWQQERGVLTERLTPEAAREFLAVDVAAAASKPARPRAAPDVVRHEAPAPRMADVRRGAVPASTATASAGADDAPRRAALAKIALQVESCRLCPLGAAGRTHTVPGQGNPLSPDVMFIGEAPGAEEDAQGLAFVGAAGQLLTKMIAAMGYTRDEIFIANICKCRPPANRQPTLDEMRACFPYLRAQIAIIKPRVLVALGATAVKGLLDTHAGITRLRGTWTAYEGIPLMPTYHPAYLLRLPAFKREAWEDLKLVLRRLGRPIPTRAKAAGAGGA